MRSNIFELALAAVGKLPKMPGCDWPAVAIGSTIGRKMTLPQRWFAERLPLGSARNVSERVHRFDLTDAAKLTMDG